MTSPVMLYSLVVNAKTDSRVIIFVCSHCMSSQQTESEADQQMTLVCYIRPMISKSPPAARELALSGQTLRDYSVCLVFRLLPLRPSS